jgi:hypothetical protein
MFKVVEINRQTAEAAEMEKGKKSWVECRHRREATMPILERLVNELEKYVGWLTSKELETLLRWKGVPVSKMGNIIKQIHPVPTICRGKRIVVLPRERRTTRLSSMREATLKPYDSPIRD